MSTAFHTLAMPAYDPLARWPPVDQVIDKPYSAFAMALVFMAVGIMDAGLPETIIRQESS